MQSAKQSEGYEVLISQGKSKQQGGGGPAMEG